MKTAIKELWKNRLRIWAAVISAWLSIKAIYCASFGHDWGEGQRFKRWIPGKPQQGSNMVPIVTSIEPYIQYTCKRCGKIESRRVTPEHPNCLCMLTAKEALK